MGEWQLNTAENTYLNRLFPKPRCMIVQQITWIWWIDQFHSQAIWNRLYDNAHHLNLKNPPRKGREEYYHHVGKQIFGAMASGGSSQKWLKKFKNQSATGNPRKAETLEKSKSREFFNAYNPTVEYIGYAGHPSDDYKEALKSSRTR